MKIKLLKSFNRVIALLLSIIGVGTACTSGCEYGSPAEEYGVPRADFKVTGTVTASTKKLPLQGIQVAMEFDTAFTDQNGNYMVMTSSFPESAFFIVKFRDVDGEVHGSYLGLDTLVVFENPTFTGGNGNWYQGEANAILNVELTADNGQ